MIQTKLLASILSCNFLKLGDEIKETIESGCDKLHLDIMDGNFVPNITIGPDIVKQIKSISSVELDVHLMLKDSEFWAEKFIDCGADSVSVHYESTLHSNRLINYIKNRNIRALVSINPASTPLVLEYLLEYVDGVLIMSVNPGFGGQTFIDNSLRKIEFLANWKIKNNFPYFIQVDGGISLDNAKDLINAGANELIIGSAFFKYKQGKKEFVNKFREISRMAI